MKQLFEETQTDLPKEKKTSDESQPSEEREGKIEKSIEMGERLKENLQKETEAPPPTEAAPTTMRPSSTIIPILTSSTKSSKSGAVNYHVNLIILFTTFALIFLQ